VADQTRRFRADSSFTYAYSAEALTEYARDSEKEFDFGPLDQQGMLQGGLTVTGPDLTGVVELMAGIPGITEWDA
jgi:hypothetical protein